ncbi:MAG: helix-turn-helix domain-containing protein [Acidobacteria bacterium]|nr:helix-turn-helix domain-containing protein [Acidobacteriota bacterium]MDW7984717.1 helix-turn-helix domain-containing protein [Acidobacteriota bacterium]
MFYTVREAAVALGVCVWTLWKLIDMGEVRVVRVGPWVRIAQDEVERLYARFHRKEVFLVPHDLARLCRVSYKFVLREIHRSHLRVRKLQTRYIIHPDDATRWLQGEASRCS